jgi:hypothetical protein
MQCENGDFRIAIIKTHDELYDDQIGGEMLFASRARGQAAWSPVKLVKYDRRVGRGRLKA